MPENESTAEVFGKPDYIVYNTKFDKKSGTLKVIVTHKHKKYNKKQRYQKEEGTYSTTNLFTIKLNRARRFFEKIKIAWDSCYRFEDFFDEYSRVSKEREITLSASGLSDPTIEGFLSKYVSDRNTKEGNRKTAELIEYDLKNMRQALFKDVEDGSQQLDELTF